MKGRGALRGLHGVLLGGSLLAASACHPAVSSRNHHMAIEHYNGGLRNLKNHQLQGAFWEFEYANHLDPNIPKVHYSLGHVYYLMHDMTDARIELKKALRHNEDPSSTYNYLGEIALEEREYPEALKNFHMALKNTLNKTPYFPLANIGKVYMLTGKYEKAKEFFAKAILRNDRFLPAYYWLGKVHLTEGAYEKALADFSQTIRLAPNFSAGYYEIGKTYLKLDNPIHAAEAFEEAVRLDPNSKVGVKSKRYLLLLPRIVDGKVVPKGTHKGAGEPQSRALSGADSPTNEEKMPGTRSQP
ncbi:MAG: tetratricopeptide repeat protein [Leptospirales bacterium]